MKVGFISLGCNKNLVDTEKTIALFKKNNFEIVNKPEEAQIIVVNTCGFIESAKEEAINTLLEMAEYKKQNCKYLIAMGCLVKRYEKELEKALPEVDLYIPYGTYDTLWEQIENLLKEDKSKNNSKNKDIIKDSKDSIDGQDSIENKKASEKTTLKTKKLNSQEDNIFEEKVDRVITTGENYAYLKIADGCSNFCTYCAIPKIRGKLKSRTIENIMEEANKLVKQGYKEIILTAQDTTKYGEDIYGKPMLAELLKKLCEIKEIKWIRFLYAYPETITDELIQVVKNNEKICKYFDIPIQHISDSVLKRMNRKSSGKSIRNLVIKLRKEIPNVILRTTVMVGFPGETKEEFEELYEFLSEAKFDKLGAFSYSKEEETPAYCMPNQVHPSTKKSRYRKVMELQQKISKQNLEGKIGKTIEVMIEGITRNKKFYVGRSYMDIPEIDGKVYIENKEKLNLGDFVLCKIINVNEYDLMAEYIGKNS